MSKKPVYPSHEHLRVHPIVRLFDSGIGNVKPTPLRGEGNVLPEKIMSAKTSLRIKLKSAAEIRIADLGQSDPRTTSQKRDPPCFRRNVIAKQRVQACKITCLRVELNPTKQLSDYFEVPSEKVVFTDDIGDDVTGIDGPEREIVRFPASEFRFSEASSSQESGLNRVLPEAPPKAVLPDPILLSRDGCGPPGCRFSRRRRWISLGSIG